MNIMLNVRKSLFKILLICSVAMTFTYGYHRIKELEAKVECLEKQEELQVCLPCSNYSG